MVTALEGCDKYCKDFQVEQRDLYRDGDEIKREFRCANTDKCLALIEVLLKATVKAENL